MINVWLNTIHFCSVQGTDISHRLRASESQAQRMRTEGEQLRAELGAAQQATAAAIAIPRGMTAADAAEMNRLQDCVSELTTTLHKERANNLL